MMLPFVLLWFLLLAAAVIGAIVILLRRGAAGALHALALCLGTLLLAGFLSAGIGWLEGGATALGTSIAVLVGAIGVGLVILGTRGLRRLAVPGTCTACGYVRRGLSPTTACPECGLLPDASGRD